MNKIIFLLAFFVTTVFASNIIKASGMRLFSDGQNGHPSNQNNTAWTTAFDNLHSILAEEYAFTDWKQIDWQALYEQYRSEIVAAEVVNDTAAYFIALRKYIYSIPDGHMECLANSIDYMINLMEEYFGGSYGLALIGLDDGRVVARIVIDDGPAAIAGMKIGAEILQWNGKPIEQALQDVSELWGYNPSATNEVRRIRQYRFIGRDTVGAEASVTYKNPSETLSTTVVLTAVYDDLETYWLTHFYPLQEDYIERVKYELLESGYGYLKVTSEGFSEATCQLVQNKFKEAMEYFVNQNVPGIILDFRRNAGGFDEVIAYMAGFFYDQPAHYEHITYYNKTTGNFEITATLNIEPQSPYFTGRVIAMVGPGGISSGEGLAMAIQKLPLGQVISFYASNGSFGMAAGNYDMPCGISITYTNGQSLDLNGMIQIDSDASGNGGIIPDIRVPLNDETFYQAFVEGKDVELNFVIETLDKLTEIENDQITRHLGIQLQQNYPNPFNAGTKISWQSSVNSWHTLKVYDVLGNEIGVLMNEEKVAGYHSIDFDASNLPSGVYIYQLKAGNFIETRKMILLK